MLDGQVIKAARETLVDKIKRRMEELGTNQSAVALEAGLGRSAVRDIIVNDQNPRIDTLRKLTGPLKCSLEYLTGSDGSSTWDENTNQSSSLLSAGSLSPLAVLRTILCANPTAEQILAALAANGFGVVPLGSPAPRQPPSDGMAMLRSLSTGKVEAGLRIAEVRKEKGITQEKMAELLDCHPITVSKLERNEMDLTIEWLLRIADALQVDAGTFLNKAEAVDDPLAFVNEILERRKITSTELAKAVGLAASTLNRWIKNGGEQSLNVRTLQKIKEWDKSQEGT